MKSYNSLMYKYLMLLDNKEMYTKIMKNIGNDIYVLQLNHAFHKNMPSFPKTALAVEKRKLKYYIREYNNNVDRLSEITNDIAKVSKEINNVRTHPKKVKFFIPGTENFDSLKSKYSNLLMETL